MQPFLIFSQQPCTLKVIHIEKVVGKPHLKDVYIDLFEVSEKKEAIAKMNMQMHVSLKQKSFQGERECRICTLF